MTAAKRARATRSLAGTTVALVAALGCSIVAAATAAAATGGVATAAVAARPAAPPAAAAPPTAATAALLADGARLYHDECGSCHVAFPPRALPQASWRALMGSLDRHFDTDASLDAASATAITAWLDADAGRARYAEHERDGENDRAGRRTQSVARENGARDGAAAGPVVLRITETSWFRREHREIGVDVWRRAAVRGPSNCGACHAGAAAGRFGEHDVRIPR